MGSVITFAFNRLVKKNARAGAGVERYREVCFLEERDGVIVPMGFDWRDAFEGAIFVIYDTRF